MLEFSNLPDSRPYQLFHQYYQEAEAANQVLTYAFAVSSYNPNTKIVDSRFVNLKYIDGNDWIFFTNYKGPKAQAFEGHNQISALFNWTATRMQIRIKATIKKIDLIKSDEHFKGRIKEKNAVAIASNQSQKIESYEAIEEKYKKVLENEDLSKRPDYWGGFAFSPFYIEFWNGKDTRLNHRQVFELIDEDWQDSILQP